MLVDIYNEIIYIMTCAYMQVSKYIKRKYFIFCITEARSTCPNVCQIFSFCLTFTFRIKLIHSFVFQLFFLPIFFYIVLLSVFFIYFFFCIPFLLDSILIYFRSSHHQSLSDCLLDCSLLSCSLISLHRPSDPFPSGITSEILLLSFPSKPGVSRLENGSQKILSCLDSKQTQQWTVGESKRFFLLREIKKERLGS